MDTVWLHVKECYIIVNVVANCDVLKSSSKCIVPIDIIIEVEPVRVDVVSGQY